MVVPVCGDFSGGFRAGPFVKVQGADVRPDRCCVLLCMAGVGDENRKYQSRQCNWQSMLGLRFDLPCYCPIPATQLVRRGSIFPRNSSAGQVRSYSRALESRSILADGLPISHPTRIKTA
jgi:hypothetical protein